MKSTKKQPHDGAVHQGLTSRCLIWMGFHLQCETVENIAATLMTEITIKKTNNNFPSPKQSEGTADLEKINKVIRTVTERLQVSGEVVLLLKIYGANELTQGMKPLQNHNVYHCGRVTNVQDVVTNPQMRYKKSLAMQLVLVIPLQASNSCKLFKESI